MSWRKSLFWIHLAMGCLVGLIVLALSVTGVLADSEVGEYVCADNERDNTHIK